MPEVKQFDEILKKNLVDLLSNYEETRDYLPNNPNHKRLSKDFILSVLYWKKQDLFKELYEKVCDIKFEKRDVLKEKCLIPILNEFNDKLKNYSSPYNEPISKQYFNVKKKLNVLIENGAKIKQRMNENNNNNIQMNLNQNVAINLNNQEMNSVINNSMNNSNLNNNYQNFTDYEFSQHVESLLNVIWNNNSNEINQNFLDEGSKKQYYFSIVKKVMDTMTYQELYALPYTDQLNCIFKFFNN